MGLKKERPVSQLACTEHSQVSQYVCALIITKMIFELLF